MFYPPNFRTKHAHKLNLDKHVDIDRMYNISKRLRHFCGRKALEKGDF